MKEDILKWKKATDLEKEKVICKVFDKVNSENELNLLLDTNMPDGYENANAMINILENKVFINIEMAKKDMSIMPLFSLIHEIRHAIQYKYKSSFSPLLIRSLDYVIMYDGNAYKLIDNSWKHCILEESKEYCTELYLLSPNEFDANNYAYDYLLNIVPEFKSELDDIINFWTPKYHYIKRNDVEIELNNIFNYIDNHIS